MFREMRRKKQQLPKEEVIEILKRGSSGVLALTGDEDYPYAVPMSYVYEDGKLYFHGAKQGHRFDAVSRNEKASFCVIEQDIVVPERYLAHYKSVIAFGRISVIEDETFKRRAIEILADKYHPTATEEFRNRAIEAESIGLCMFVLEIEHMTGKEAKELASRRKVQDDRADNGRYACPCCGYYTYKEPKAKSHGFICPVCFWENDKWAKAEEDISEANHGLTLMQAKENYRQFGACAEGLLSYVRPPADVEKKIGEN